MREAPLLGFATLAALLSTAFASEAWKTGQGMTESTNDAVIENVTAPPSAPAGEVNLQGVVRRRRRGRGKFSARAASHPPPPTAADPVVRPRRHRRRRVLRRVDLLLHQEEGRSAPRRRVRGGEEEQAEVEHGRRVSEEI